MHLIAQELSPGSVTSPALAVVFILILALGMGADLVFSVTPALQLNPGGMPHAVHLALYKGSQSCVPCFRNSV